MTTNTSPPPPTSEAAPLNPMPDVEKVFKRFDSNGDGKISSSELGSMIGALGPSPSKDELGRMMAEMDTNGDGFIDLKEFAHFNSGQQGGDGDGEEAAAEEVLKEAFDMYDIDKNGLISAGELNMVLKKLGEKCSVEDCSRMITSVDSDGDGNVNFHEFKKMMSNSKASPV